MELLMHGYSQRSAHPTSSESEEEEEDQKQHQSEPALQSEEELEDDVILLDSEATFFPQDMPSTSIPKNPTSVRTNTLLCTSPAPDRAELVEEEGIIQPAKRGRKVSSFVWAHFLRDPKDKCIVQCKHCRQHVRLGREGKVGTTSMHRHLQLHHSYLLPPKKAGLTSTLSPSLDAYSTSPTSSSAPVAAVTPTARGKTQLAMQETLALKSTWHATDPRAMECNQWLAEFIAKGMHPLTLVDDPSFREFLQRCMPQWKVPGRKYFVSTAIPALGASVRAALKRNLKDCVGGSVHLTVDIWTSCQAQDYMSVTAHWIVHDHATGDLVRHNAVLDMSGFGGAQTAANISHKLIAVLDTWLPPLGVSVGYVAADNVANIVKALRDSALAHLPCMAHCLNVVVKGVLSKIGGDIQDTLKTARAICSHFRHSVSAQTRLQEVQRQFSVPQNCLVQDVATLWTSTLHMIHRLYEQRRALTEFFEDASDLQLSPWQWGLLKELISALRPFEEVIRLLSKDDATLGQVLPLIRFLEKYLLQLKHGTDPGSPSHDLLSDLLVQLRTSRPLKGMQENIVYWVASYLDPRFRDTFGNYVGETPGGPVSHKLDAVRDYLLSETVEAYLRQTCGLDRAAPWEASSTFPSQSNCSSSGLRCEEAMQATPPSTFDNSDLLWDSCFDYMGLTAPRVNQDHQARSRTEGAAVARQELEAYSRDDVSEFSSPQSAPAKYWARKQHTWPALHAVAVRFLACPPSSVYSEQLFSSAGRIVTGSRNGLKSDNANLLCFIRMNCAWIPKDSSSVPPEVMDRLSRGAEEHSGQEGEEDSTNPVFQRAIFGEEDCATVT